MTPFSIEVQTLFRLLEDREWHDFREVKERLASSIAPGKALRRYEARVERRRDRGGHSPMTNEPTEDEKIGYGQNLIADSAVQQVKRNYLEIDNNGGGFGRKMIRLKPGVETPVGKPFRDAAGAKAPEERPADPIRQEAPVEPSQSDEDVLGEPPEPVEPVSPAGPVSDPVNVVLNDPLPEREPMIRETPARRDVALFDEKEVRAIVAEEVGIQLDRFQAGLQNWLEQTFGGGDHTCVIRSLIQPPSPVRVNPDDPERINP